MASDKVSTRVTLASQEPGKDYELRFASLDVTGTETFETGLKEVKAAFVTIQEDLIDAQEYPATVTISNQTTEPGQVVVKTWKMTNMQTDTTPTATTTNPVTCHLLVIGVPY